jgi:5'-AMP-activated protein kinase regulatory gamma subunit
MTINEALSYRKERFEAVAKCYKHEQLATCIERIIRAEVHRLVIVDDEEHVIGILSLSDLLNFIILRPSKPARSLSEPTPVSSGPVGDAV